MVLTILALAAARPTEPTKSSPEIDVGRRLVAAIKGESDFADADFAKPLTAADKAALRQFAGCKVRKVQHTSMPLPNRRLTFVENPNDIAIGLDCKGVPYDSPVGISLRFENGKVVKVETHNADLMRVD